MAFANIPKKLFLTLPGGLAGTVSRIGLSRLKQFFSGG
jgi:hypothetical protein